MSVCLDRFCMYHGHHCNPDQLTEPGAQWICPNPHCRTVWTCVPVAAITSEIVRKHMIPGATVMRGRRYRDGARRVATAHEPWASPQDLARA